MQAGFRVSGCGGFGLVSFLFSGGRVRDGGTGVPVVIAVGRGPLVKVVSLFVLMSCNWDNWQFASRLP